MESFGCFSNFLYDKTMMNNDGFLLEYPFHSDRWIYRQKTRPSKVFRVLGLEKKADNMFFFYLNINLKKIAIANMNNTHYKQNKKPV